MKLMEFTMKRKGHYYVDGKNKWSGKLFTPYAAMEGQKTLANCINCINCPDHDTCANCHGCIGWKFEGGCNPDCKSCPQTSNKGIRGDK